MFAHCCLRLGRFKNGIQALERSKSLWSKNDNWGKHSEISRRIFPDAASIYCLLGKLYQGYNDVKAAVDSYTEALKLNPFMWDAFTYLCDIGVTIRIPNIFNPSPNMLASTSEPSSSGSPFSNIPNTSSRGNPGDHRSNQSRTKTLSNADPLSTSTRHNLQSSTGEPKLFLRPMKVPDMPSKDRTNGGIGTGHKISGGADAVSVSQELDLRTARDDRGGISACIIPGAPKQKNRSLEVELIGVQARLHQAFTKKGREPRPIRRDRASEALPQDSGSSALVVDRERPTSALFTHGQSQEMSGGAVGTRRSARLKSQFRSSNISSLSNTGNDREFRVPKAPSLKRPGKSATSTVGHIESNRSNAEESESCPEAPSFLPPTSVSRPTEGLFQTSERHEALYWLLDLFKQLGKGYYLLTHFKCQEALEVFDSIPSAQRETVWVLSQLGRAHFEKANYAEAAQSFAKVRAISSLSTEDMDIYSTSLWHLKHDVDLAFLSYELVELDRLSPQTWCAVGNSFSLQRDHSNAIRCFRRATQLDPKFAYAFTLEGYEHISNEEYDKAIQAFRSGITAKKRHYNAWYGLGITHQKLGKFDQAETYFRVASKINPANAVLIGCIGMALEGRKELNMALQCYTRACDVSPNSVFAREKKADILLKLKDLHGASVELALLRDIAPQKAYVYILLGRMYSLANEKGKAMQNFTIALSINPQASQSIRSEIESFEDEVDK